MTDAGASMYILWRVIVVELSHVRHVPGDHDFDGCARDAWNGTRHQTDNTTLALRVCTPMHRQISGDGSWPYDCFPQDTASKQSRLRYDRR